MSDIEPGKAITPETDLDDFIQERGSDIVQAWTEKWGAEALRGTFRTALICICRVREAREAAYQAQLLNATFGNRAAGITDAEVDEYIQNL